MITPLAPGAPRPRSFAAAPSTTAPVPDEQQADGVALSGAEPPRALPARRPLFAEAARLGLMASGAVIGGPLGQSLSPAAQEDLGHVLDEMVAAGLSFARHGNPENLQLFGDTPLPTASVKEAILRSNGSLDQDKLTVSGPNMRFAHIQHLSELEGLEALAVRHDASALPDADRAQTLLDLAARGKRFFVNADEESSTPRLLDHLNEGTMREVGPYGAWRAFHEPPPPPVELKGDSVTVKVDHSEAYRVYMSNVDPDPFGFSMRPVDVPTRIVRDEGLAEAAFFELGATHEKLEKDPLAVSLRDLSRKGMTFHFGMKERGQSLDRTALGVYHEANGRDLYAGVWGEGRMKITVDQLHDPSTLPQPLKDLTQFFAEHVEPKRTDGQLDDRGTVMWVRAASRKAADMPMEQRAAVLEHFYAHEKEIGTRPQARAFFAARLMEAFAGLLEPGEDPAKLAAELEDLATRKVLPDVAGEAVAYFRQTLPRITFNDADFQAQREQLVQVAAMAPAFKKTLEARELIAYTQPFDSGIALLRHTVETDAALKAPEKSGPTVDSILEDPPLPFDNAMADYKLVLAHKLAAETPSSAANALRTLHTLLVPQHGWACSRQAFVFLQRGAALQAFGDKTRDQALETFVSSFVVSRDVETACRATLALGNSDARIITDDKTGDVIVGGIRIPRRQP